VDRRERHPPDLPRKSANPLFWTIVLAAAAAALVVLWNMAFN
jgi:hypothetical protein